MGMPLMCGRARPFIVSPIAYPPDYLASIAGEPDLHPAPKKTQRHVIQIALEWKQMLATDKGLTRAQLARQQGLTRARVTQIRNLLRLPPAILKTLHTITERGDERRYPERALRQILLLKSPAEQLRLFRNLQETEYVRRNLAQQSPLQAQNLAPDSCHL